HKGQELGLGSSYLAAPLAFMAQAGQILALQEIKLKCFLSVGYPAEKPAMPKRKDLGEIYREL
ncbi:MAG: hypothetical protein L7F78_11840, partial [Syntrophales bacterium LBB04]|nr:hypothetical protein [Syntrophales bacterium LBB04]